MMTIAFKHNIAIGLLAVAGALTFTACSDGKWYDAQGILLEYQLIDVQY